MRFFALASARIPALAATFAASLALIATPSFAQPDPPAQAGRISYITGNVSFQPVGSDDWGQAVPNLTLGPGDRIVTDDDSRAEIQVGQTFVRIGPNADVSLIDSTPAGVYFGIAQGSLHMHTRGLWMGQSVFVNTPSGSATQSIPGELRVDVLPDQQAALFTVTGPGSQVELNGAGGYNEVIRNGQALELAGSNPVVPQWLETAQWDPLDRWSMQRDQQIANSLSYQYASPEIPGVYELDAAGTWQPGTPYGAVWFPNVGPNWAPYHNGHWVNHAPWGWVWIEDEQWGYAPFHYGRWVSLEGRWGWVPGPPSEHPVWSPALVVFAGGSPGVSAWIPLGPGEPYRPWYHTSPEYIDRINISNITVTDRVHVQTTYVNFNFGSIVFVNRARGFTAIRNEDFAAGRPASQVSVNVDVHIFDHVNVMAAPEPRPTAQSFTGRPPARPVRVSAARPVLINEKGKAVAAAPNARPVEPPVKPAPVVKPLPGHVATAPPSGARNPQGKGPSEPMRPTGTPAPRQEEKPSAPSPATRPAPATETRPAPPTAIKPGPATTTKPAEKPATPPATTAPAPATKPGEKPAPPAANDKNKKNDKDKKDKEPKDKPQPQ